MEVNKVTISIAEYRALIEKAYEYDKKYAILKAQIEQQVELRKKIEYESKIDLLNQEIHNLRLQIEEENIKNAAIRQYYAEDDTKQKKKHWWSWK